MSSCLLTGLTDYEPLNNKSVLLTREMSSVVINVTIIDDDIIEAPREGFLIIFNDGGLNNVLIQDTQFVVYIRDNDCEYLSVVMLPSSHFIQWARSVLMWPLTQPHP